MQDRGFGITVFGVGGVVVALAMLFGAGKHGSVEAPSKPAPSTQSPRAVTPPPDVIAPNDPAKYPKMHDDLGEAGFKYAQMLRKRVGWAVANMQQCDRLEYVDVAMSRSMPGDIHTFADCRNGYRARFSQDEALALPGPNLNGEWR